MTHPKNHITKSICFSYPTSANAKELGMYESGCWHVSQIIHNIEGSGQANTYLPQGCEGFDDPAHPDLIALFNEYEGEPSQAFLLYGNPRALAALNLKG